MERLSIPLAILLTILLIPALAQAQPEDAAPVAPAPEITDPLVREVLDLKPRTPEQQIRAILILIDLKHPAAAKPLVDQLVAAALDQPTLAKLTQQFGTPAFLKIAAAKELNPAATQLAQSVLDAAEKAARDPQRIATLVQDLADPTPAVRNGAIAGLRSAGAAAVIPLLEALADPARSAARPAATAALASLGADAVEPLVAVVKSNDPALVIPAIGALAAIGEPSVRLDLLPLIFEGDETVRRAASEAWQRFAGSPPTRRQAAQLLYEAAVEFDNGRRLPPVDLDGATSEWRWNPATRQMSVERLPRPIVAIDTAARLADAAYRLEPYSPEIARLRLAAMLESAGRRLLPDEPLPSGAGTAHDLAYVAGQPALAGLLDWSLATGHHESAARAAELLGQMGSEELLHRADGRVSALVKALWNNDRNVQFAALRAIINLKPTLPFAGSNRVTSALAYFASAGGRPVALVAAPKAAEAQRLAGLLANLGFEARIQTNGRWLFLDAVDAADCELILLSYDLYDPTAAETLVQLRNDTRTAAVPVGLVASVDRFDAADHASSRYPRVMALIRPHDVEAMRFEVEQLLALWQEPPVDALGRQERARLALVWLAQLAEQRPTLFDVGEAASEVERALHVPALAAEAANLLSMLPQPKAQQALVELAGNPAMPIEERKIAQEAFRRSVARFGVQMTTSQMLAQYDHYNTTSAQDLTNREILGQIIDAMEMPWRNATGTAAEGPSAPTRQAPREAVPPQP